MTREVLIKRKITGYMLIDFKHAETPVTTEVMLVAVNYDTEILTLRPFPDSNPFEQDEFPAHISMCEFSRYKLKLIK